VSRNSSTFCVSSFRVDVQAVAYVDQLPALRAFPDRSAGNLKCNEDESHSGELGKQVRLDGPNEPSIVPVHQVSLPDGFNKIHRPISKLRVFQQCNFTFK
jgi:hypothetical protein